MKLPARSSEITLAEVEIGPYPPLGFAPFPEGELGNGDRFGLYWPIGREQDEPIVCDMSHDAATLIPAFSSLDRFLNAYEEADGWTEPPTLEQDGQSPVACYAAAREALGQKDFDVAVELLERALERLPEYGAALTSLFGQYLRLRRQDQAFEIALRTLRSPLAFGSDARQALRWLKAQEDCPVSLADDPLWLRRNELEWNFGGVETNSTYGVLADAIESYKSCGNAVATVSLMQVYGELMSRETISFRERSGFDTSKHVDDLCEYSRTALASRDALAL